MTTTFDPMNPETQRALDAFVQREVVHCVSSLVSTLAQGHGRNLPGNGLEDVTEAASELCAPIEDYEEAAIQEGWIETDSGWAPTTQKQMPDGDVVDWAWLSSHDYYPDAETVCSHEGIDPHEREVFEHWIVSDWLASKLEEHGERVDRDFWGLCIWGRTTTGQGIAMDSVIINIYRELHSES